VHYGFAGKPPQPGNCTFDLWPDLSEMGPEEKFATSFRHQDGSPAFLFSSYRKDTVARHFQWMEEYGIDGVFLQRFGASLKEPRVRNHRDVVLKNVQAGARDTGRAWALMYDLSGLQKGDIEKHLIADWKRLVDGGLLTSDKRYLHHDRKPVIAVWGIGFNDGRDYSLDECEQLIRFLKNDPDYGGNTVMLGVPTYWRTLERDTIPDPQLHEIIQLADIVNPWTVGRYENPQAATDYANTTMREDIAWADEQDLDYLPVLFPGFSWHNLEKARGREAALGQIPRRQGRFLWAQAEGAKKAGANMAYVAMFDEIDEGTAIFKIDNDPPIGESPFLTFENVPGDHYLWLTGQITRGFRASEVWPNDMPTRESSAP
jgi:hypothetical protein